MTPETKDSEKTAAKMASSRGPNDVQVKISSAREAAHRPPAQLLRRVPRQERGRERVERILDAAAAVIAEIGVDAMTTNAVALRADTSVGSLYQFFPNKRAIVEALAARYNAELHRINEEVMSSQAVSFSMPELVGRVVTSLMHFHEANPAYRHVYHAMNGPDGPSCGEAELHKAVVSRLEEVISARTPGVPPEKRHVHCTVAVLTVHALLGFAMTASPVMREKIVQELKGLMTSYMEETITTRFDTQRPSPRQSAKRVSSLDKAIDKGFAEV